MPSNTSYVNQAPALRLHQIHSSMPFGHTEYVPEEETRNLRANFPEPDILQAFKELASPEQQAEDIADTSEPIALSKEATVKFCNDMANSSLSHPNYRKLAWSTIQGDYEDSFEYSKRIKVKKVTSPASFYTGGRKSSSPSGISISLLESRYRLGHAIPFCLNPQAAYLIQHATIMGQRKRMARELGTNVFYLNDRNHIRALEQHLQTRWERRGDFEHKLRAHEEYQKRRDTTGGMVDELPSIYSANQAEVSKGRKESGRSSEKFPEYTSDFRLPEMFTRKKSKISLVVEPETTAGETVPAVPELPENDTGVTGSENSESAVSSLDSAEGILSSRLTMRNLYDRAERSVRVKHEITKRYLKYKDLSWQRE